MTIGDVLATVTGILAACASLWAALVVTLMLFPARAAQAAERIEQRPWHCARVGVLVAGLAGLVTIVLLNQPNGFFKLLGWFSLAFLLALATFGSAGLSRVVADRILTTNTDLPPIRAAGYGAGLLVATGLLPVLGWLIFASTLLTSLGAAALTLRPAKKPKAFAATPLAAEYAHE